MMKIIDVKSTQIAESKALDSAICKEHLLQSYDYDLPTHLIASTPIYPKKKARLLVYDRASNTITHTHFNEFFNVIPKDCLIVLNNTKVLKARIFGVKQSGARIELLYHSFVDTLNMCYVQIRGKIKEGDIIIFKDSIIAKVVSKLDNGLRIVEFSKNGNVLDKDSLIQTLENIGSVPLPPYIKRTSNQNDVYDYQSVFAAHFGAIAAPTASLHFDDNDVTKIRARNHCFITLHIGAGTFFGVESSNITNHKMHEEEFFITKEAQDKIDNAKNILCIGTTACRCVEFYARNGLTSGLCDIFINPLNKPIKTNYLLTNFHLPKSTLIMLVAGFIGLDKTLEIYNIAKDLEYRFYSYGDGMLIL